MAKEKYQGQNSVKKILSAFFRFTDDFKKSFNILDTHDKRVIYVEALEKVSDAIEKYDQDVLRDYDRFKHNYSQIKQLSELLTWLENETEQELFEEFYDFNHLINFELPIFDDGRFINYLFNTGNSSELFDVKENKAKAIYYSACLDNVGLLDRLFMALAMNLHEDANNVIELYDILSSTYKKLKSTLSKKVKHYIREKLDCYSILLHNNDTFKLLSEAEEIEKREGPSFNATSRRKKVILNLIKLFANQPQELDKLTLTIIACNIELLELPISHQLRADLMEIINALCEKDQFYWFKQSVKMDEEISWKEDEMKKFENEHLKLTDFKKMREHMVLQLYEFAKKI